MKYIKSKKLFTGLFTDKKYEKLLLELINFSDSIYSVPNVDVMLEKTINPRYASNVKTIYLSNNYTKDSEPFYSMLEKEFGVKYYEFIAFHEMGHAVQDHLKIIAEPVDVKYDRDLNYLFNGSVIPHKINNFLIDNYREAYADCYAGLCLYKKYKDINIFDKISLLRQSRAEKMIKDFGTNFIHPNFNYDAPKIFKQIIENFEKNKVNIFDLKFANSKNNIEML